MDVDATLARLRAAESAWSLVDTFEDAARVGAELADAFQDLDEWLSKGGFLPRAWESSVTTTRALMIKREG